MLMRTVVLTIAAILLASCNNYKMSLCPEESRIDVAGLEGNYDMVPDPANHIALPSFKLGITRTARGSYQVTANGKSVQHFTCEAGGKTILETLNAIGTFTANFIKPTEKGFSYSTHPFDRSLLDQKGIIYSIEEHEGNKEVLVVDNQGLRTEDLFSALRLDAGLRFDMVKAQVPMPSPKPAKK
jgi:hypothetical protein